MHWGINELMSAKYIGQGLAHTTRGQLGMLPKLGALNQGALAKSGDIFGCTTGSGATGILGVEPRDAAQYPTVHRMALQPRMLWSPMSIMLTVGYSALNPNAIAEGISLYSVCLWQCMLPVPWHVAKFCFSFLA